MNKLAASLVFLLVITGYTAIAQKGIIKGTVTDTLAKQNLHYAVISLLRNKDTVLYTFTRANNQGSFELNNLAAGKYLLMVSYPSYADYTDHITLEENTTLNLGRISMLTKAHLLEDVTVRQKIAAIKLKGDTIEYKADSFKVREGASVEEMLKKLPGIQVDKDGNITAQGEAVQKVLVDGEEFFGDDPTIATRNLEAAAIDKVQVFDKKSDQAVFTGIDDGQKTKTINLTLKEDKKHGYFGKMELGGGSDDKWNNSLMANAFKNKRKLSFYSIMSSTGQTGLNWDDRSKYGDNSGMTTGVTDDGGMYMSINNDEFSNSNYYGSGLPKNWSVGINYSNKYNGDKEALNGSYRYNKLMSEGSSTNRTQSILPDTLFYNNQVSNSFSVKDRHTLYGTFDWTIDSSLSAKLVINAYKGTSSTWSTNNGVALNAVNDTVNLSNRNNSGIGDNQSLNTSFLLRKKFKRPGRTLSFNIDQKYLQNHSDGYLYALNQFFDKAGTRYESDTTDQKKTNNNSNNTVNTRLVYTEALSSSFIIEADYGLNNTRSESKLLSYDKDGTGKYETLNTLYSNDYSYNILTNVVGTMFRFNKKKYSISAGGDMAKAHFTQKDELKDTVSTYNYTNFFPRVISYYKFNQNSRVNFNYNGNTNQPTIQQIQPVVNNSNPLNIAIGNPNLKQEFRHTFRLSYNSYKVLKERGFFLSANYNITTNAIRTSTNTDSSGKSLYQYINTNGNYNYGGYLSFNSKLKKIDVHFNAYYNINISNNVTYINGIKNNTATGSHALGVSFYKSKDNKYDIDLNATFMYNTSTSSIRPDVNNNYWSMTHSLDATVQLPLKFELNNNIQFNIREKTAIFPTNNNVVLWNAYLAKKILKKDKAQIRFTAHDILDQNKGFNRNINSISVTEYTYQTIRRYFMLSFIWNFSKNALTDKTN